MRRAGVIAVALASCGILPQAARADVAVAVTADVPFAQCGSARRAQLKRALARYCDGDGSADQRACHIARRALRCERLGRGPGRDCAADNAASMLAEDDGEVTMHVSEGCGGDWNIRFARAGRGYRVSMTEYVNGSCCGP
jgi:hypothetical protein